MGPGLGVALSAVVLVGADDAAVRELFRRLEVTFTEDQAHMGRAGPPLRGEAFYDYVGATSLRDLYLRRRHALDRLGLIGGQSVTASVSLMIIGAAGVLCERADAFCSPVFDVLLWAGTGVAAFGLGAVTYATLADAHPVRPLVRRQLAADFNRELRQRLRRSSQWPKKSSGVRFVVRVPFH